MFEGEVIDSHTFTGMLKVNLVEKAAGSGELIPFGVNETDVNTIEVGETEGNRPCDNAGTAERTDR